ncbi:MAG: histidinol-phosphate transaminase [Clostridiales bacterium]
MIKAKDCIRGITPYKPGKPIDDVKRELGLSEVYKLASNENPLGTPPSAVEAMRVMASACALYPDGYGYDLRMSISEKLGVKPGELIFGDGSNEIIKLLSLVYLDKGDEIIAPMPSFSEYSRLAAVCGAVCKAIPLTEDFIVDLPAMVGAISCKTKIIYICNPNNPTGTVINKRLLLQMMHRIGNDILVVLDEAYFEYVDDENSPNGLDFFKEFSNVVVMRTFSKAYGLAGLRVGYAVANQSVVNDVNKVREPFNVNSLAQVAAIAAFNDKEYIKKSINYNKVERDFVSTSLKTMGLNVIPSQGNFVLVNVGIKCNIVFNELLKKGIIVRSGDVFGYPTSIRVSIGLREENNYFLKELKELL